MTETSKHTISDTIPNTINHKGNTMATPQHVLFV